MLLDLEQFDLSNIAEAVIEEMVITDQLPRAHSAKVLSALLSKHRHQHQMNRGLPRRSSSTNLAAFFGVEAKAMPMKPTETGASEATDASSAWEAKENTTSEPARPRTTSDASSQTPFSACDYLDKVCSLIVSRIQGPQGAMIRVLTYWRYANTGQFYGLVHGTLAICVFTFCWYYMTFPRMRYSNFKTVI